MERIGSKLIDDLVEAAVRGNGPAFTALWDTYIGQLQAFIRSMIKNPDDWFVDDVCSRSFEKAFRQIGTFDSSKSQFFTWLRAIAHNTALDLIETENNFHPRNQVVYLDEVSPASAAVEDIQDRMDSPLDSIIRNEDEQARVDYIEHLPELYRSVARRRFIEGLQYSEIAEKEGLELNTVRTRIRRAKDLMDRMRKEKEEEI